MGLTKVNKFVMVGMSLLLLCSCIPAKISLNPGISSQVLAKSALLRDTKPHVPEADLAAVVAGNTKFALKVFPLLDTSPNNNTFFSPYSVTQAFSLLAPGARGTTLSGIRQSLFFTLPQQRINPALNRLDLLIAGKTSGKFLQNGLQTPKLHSANAVWIQQGFPILPSYLDTIAVNYGAGLHLVDFFDATETSRKTINAWAEEQTDHRIQNLIPPNGVSPSTRIILTNAVWFKASWASQFQRSTSANMIFNNRDGSTPLVPYMRQRYSLPYARINGSQAVDIAYAGNRMSMLVIMPMPGKFDPFLATLTPDVLADITKQLTNRVMDFAMPTFSFTRASKIEQILVHLGMIDAVVPARADFSGIDGNHNLFIEDVFHQAFISSNEEGTESVAATAIVMQDAGKSRSPDMTLTIDRPFIFLIRDRETGLILFLGKVVSL